MEHQNRHRRWFEDLESFSRRVLTTVLFTDVVDSTGRLVELGDRAWARLLGNHHACFRSRLTGFGGREVDAAGDGFLAAFEVPTLAVAFACAFHDEVADLGLEVRTGVHTGECELETADSEVSPSTWGLVSPASRIPARSWSRAPSGTSLKGAN